MGGVDAELGVSVERVGRVRKVSEGRSVWWDALLMNRRAWDRGCVSVIMGRVSGTVFFSVFNGGKAGTVLGVLFSAFIFVSERMEQGVGHGGGP